MSETHPNQGERFEDDQIAGHEQTVVPLNKLHGRLMKSICAISECKEGGGVNKDRGTKGSRCGLQGFS